jgi:hypothetical protein
MREREKLQHLAVRKSELYIVVDSIQEVYWNFKCVVAYADAGGPRLNPRDKFHNWTYVVGGFIGASGGLNNG